MQWLETELRLNFNIECGTLPTGTSLQGMQGAATASQISSMPGQENTWREASGPADGDDLEGIPDGSPSTNSAPDISLLALNATGETKYLGPSSGAFFAAYATAIARSVVSGQAAFARSVSHRGDRDADTNMSATDFAGRQQLLTAENSEALLRSYRMWIHPLYPLLRLESLEGLVARCCSLQTINGDAGEVARRGEMSIFYLVMALGATHYKNTNRQVHVTHQQRNTQELDAAMLPPAYLYSRAMHYFDWNIQSVQDSISTIQTLLLISIYSCYGPVGSNQWRLVGLAMRVNMDQSVLQLGLIANCGTDGR